MGDKLSEQPQHTYYASFKQRNIEFKRGCETLAFYLH